MMRTGPLGNDCAWIKGAASEAAVAIALATALDQRGNIEGALSVLLRSIEAGADGIALRCARATILAGRLRFDDAEAELQAGGAIVWGVSPDDAASKSAFRDKFALNFPLLADPDHAVADAYGVWGEKAALGKVYEGVHRTTFLIAPDGSIWTTDVQGHTAMKMNATTARSPAYIQNWPSPEMMYSSVPSGLRIVTGRSVCTPPSCSRKSM